MDLDKDKQLFLLLFFPIAFVFLVFSFIAVISNDLLFFLPKAEEDVIFYKDSSNPPFLFFFNSYNNNEFMCFQRENREAGQVDKSVPWDAWLINKTENCTDTWRWLFNRAGTTPNLPADKTGYVNLCRTPKYDQSVCLSKVRPQQPTSTSQSDTDSESAPTLTPTLVPANNQGLNSTAGNTLSNPTPTPASATNTAKLCFYNTAEIYIDCTKDRNNCIFSTHIKFNNDDLSLKNRGSIKLERSSNNNSYKHIAGPNVWPKDSSKFNYSPEWTGGNIKLPLDRSDNSSVTIYWKGKFDGCVGGNNAEQEDIVSCTFAVRSGTPVVSGDGCYVKEVVVEQSRVNTADNEETANANARQDEQNSSQTNVSGSDNNSGRSDQSASNRIGSSARQQPTATPTPARLGNVFTLRQQNERINNLSTCRANCQSSETVETAVRRCESGSGGSYSCVPKPNLCSAVVCREKDEGVTVYTKLLTNNNNQVYYLYGLNNCTGSFEKYINQDSLSNFCGKTKRDINVQFKNYVLKLIKDGSFPEGLRVEKAQLIVIRGTNSWELEQILNFIQASYILVDEKSNKDLKFLTLYEPGSNSFQININGFDFTLADKYRINPNSRDATENNQFSLFLILEFNKQITLNSITSSTIYINLGQIGYKTKYVFEGAYVSDNVTKN